MRYETLQNEKIPKIGFGTWTIGGRNSPDPTINERSLVALRSALDLGYTFFDTAERYAAGHAEELLGQAIRELGIARQTLFITSKVSEDHLGYDEVLRSCESSLRRLKMEYLDLYLIHWPKEGMKLQETFQALNRLVGEGKVRHLGVSNFDLSLLIQSVRLSETPLFTNQVPYSITDRTYDKNGVLEYCQKNGILLTAYSPVKHQDDKGDSIVQQIASSRGVTSHQIALAWLSTQPRVITIPVSFNPQHQDENLKSADIILTETEMEQIG